MNVKNMNVFLIGGAPGVGKTTLGCKLAAKLGIASVTIDDLAAECKIGLITGHGRDE